MDELFGPSFPWVAIRWTCVFHPSLSIWGTRRKIGATGPTLLHSTKSLCLSITAQRKDAPSELLNMHQFGNIRRRSTQEFRVVFYAGTSQTLGIAVGNAHPTVHRDVRTGQQKPDVEHQPPLNGYLTFLLVITLNIVNLKTLKWLPFLCVLKQNLWFCLFSKGGGGG